MKKISKLISLILCLSLLCSTVAFAAETKQATDSPNMKDILIDSTDDHFIVVSIPESEAESYQKRLESDPEFRENECVPGEDHGTAPCPQGTLRGPGSPGGRCDEIGRASCRERVCR